MKQFFFISLVLIKIIASLRYSVPGCNVHLLVRDKIVSYSEIPKSNKWHIKLPRLLRFAR